MGRLVKVGCLIVMQFLALSGFASKLVEVKVLDKDYVMLFFKDGDVTFTENTTASYAYSNNGSSAGDNTLVTYGTALATAKVATLSNWTIKSTDDANFGSTGVSPSAVYRKSKLGCMAQLAWNSTTNDFNYGWAYDHYIYLKLPSSLVQGKSYTIEINSGINSDVNTKTFTYDINTCKTEAIKVNLVGYAADASIKAADVYMWMGDGGARDYSSFVGNDVSIYNVSTGVSQKVGTLALWKTAAAEFTDGHKFTQSTVWKADFTGFSTPGTYRLVVAGIGCSEEFKIGSDAYFDPFKVSTLGFAYMRIGLAKNSMTPVPLQPRWIPGSEPSDCKVWITSMQPYHAKWSSLGSGDQWDLKQEWATYKVAGNKTNPNAWGGHRDAMDWDRHLGHISIIYDILLPYFLTDGAISDDNLGIPESGNGIPDVIDEARYEVDYWLRVRDGKGYGHGINNPDGTTHEFYQAGTTTVAAWANAANCAMLANCFQIAGNTTLANVYRDSAVVAYNYASAQTDQQLTNTVNVGAGNITGKDLKLMAAAFLYNVTGITTYESVINTLSSCTSTTSVVKNANQNQIYAVAAYLKTKQTVNYPNLFSNMKASIINEAKTMEANYSNSRPSRRSSDNQNGWFVNEMATQRTIIAHAVSAAGSDKDFFLNALVLEADWTLGRNPSNMIQMTTATTSLATKRSVQNMYTSGWNDGSVGLHPGHTPYMNIYDWGGLIMGNPTWMVNKCYPTAFNGTANASNLLWPMGELYFNTRYVYAANEFTPQQTMRGKQALYGYLYGISPASAKGCAMPNITGPTNLCGLNSGVLATNLSANGKTFTWYKDGTKLSGQTGNTLTVTQAGVYKVDVDSNSCVKSAQTTVNASLQVNLGADIELCALTSAELDAGNASIPNVTYKWNTGDTTQKYTALKSGTYTVSVSAANCSTVSDTVLVSSKLLNVTNDTLCSAGNALLSVNGTASYNWFDAATGGTAIYAGASYTPLVSATKTYYVEEAGGLSASIGKTSMGTGSSWSLGAEYFTETDKINIVTVTKAVTLESVAVYCTTANTSVTINFKQGATVVYTKTVVASGTGKQTIPLGFTLQPGTYTVDADGTNNALTFEASGATYPYSYDGYISFTYNASWQSSWYGLFYDWKITVGSGCSRTPVVAVVDSKNAKCNGIIDQPILLNVGWNLISFYVSPTQKSVDSVFKPIIANVDEVKNYDGFWKSGQLPAYNSLKSIADGGAYLVKMKTASTLHVLGAYVTLPYSISLQTGWNLVGNPMPSVQSISSKVGSIPVQSIKNFEGFWIPGGTLNSITNFEPGKGYFIKTSGNTVLKY